MKPVQPYIGVRRIDKKLLLVFHYCLLWAYGRVFRPGTDLNYVYEILMPIQDPPLRREPGAESYDVKFKMIVTPVPVNNLQSMGFEPTGSMILGDSPLLCGVLSLHPNPPYTFSCPKIIKNRGGEKRESEATPPFCATRRFQNQFFLKVTRSAPFGRVSPTFAFTSLILPSIAACTTFIIFIAS